MPNFSAFSALVTARFNAMARGDLFTVSNDSIVEVYLKAFPEGQNPVYLTNTEHDCTCCKQFLRNIGNVVAIIGGQIQSVWAIEGAPYPYDVVAKALDEHVKSLPLSGVFLPTEGAYGKDFTLQHLEGGSVKRWEHFHGVVPSQHLVLEVGKAKSQAESTIALLQRGCTEFTLDALLLTQKLIQGNLLYRGAEFLGAVQGFISLHKAYEAAEDKQVFAYTQYKNGNARFKNSAIGTLVEDLSPLALEYLVQSKVLAWDIEELSPSEPVALAIAAYERKVSPVNYKRPTSAITPAMVEGAAGVLKDLGLSSAVDRRLANFGDVSVNNVLWVDRSVAPTMKSGIDSLLQEVKATKEVPSSAISITDFVLNELPKAAALEVFVANTLLPNFMVLTAPVATDVGALFKWDNNFAWSYTGNITDSIREKVKAAGGRVEGAKLRVSLAWWNTDDLDIHVYEPSGNLIYFGNKSDKLDVDMNAGYIGKLSTTPVENVSWVHPEPGTYSVVVDQYSCRNTSDVGCTVEIDAGGETLQLTYLNKLKGAVPACTFKYAEGKVTDLKLATPWEAKGYATTKWGVATEAYTKVSAVMLSPNYWDENMMGNKHWFFVLDGCRTDEPARGIYNEFLRGSLEEHRKVFEVLGERTKCPVVDNQMAGVGFSSTKGGTMKVKLVTFEGVRKCFEIVL